MSPATDYSNRGLEGRDKVKRLIVFYLAFLLSVSLALAKPKVTFERTVDGLKLSKRKTPATRTTESEESLKKNGYANIGYLSYEEMLNSCRGDCLKQLNCPEILLTEDDFTQEIAAKAASYGGDLIVWDQSRQKTDRISQRYCRRNVIKTRWVYTGGRHQETYDECVEWAERVEGYSCMKNGGGTVWRKQDVEFPNLIQVTEEALAKKEKENDVRLICEAVEEGNIPAIEALLKKGIDVNMVIPGDYFADSTFLDSPLLHKAGGDKKVIEYLISKGADVNARDWMGFTLMNYAVTSKEYIEFLVSRGADINTQDTDGKTPLFYVDTEDEAAVLIEYGANVNARTNDGRTFLHTVSARMGYEINRSKAIAELLISKGADLNAKANEGSTPLHDALRDRNKEVAEVLILNGADVNAEDDKGVTPLQLAKKAQYKDIMELLKNRGALK